MSRRPTITSPQAFFEPTAPEKRIDSLDIVRGFALFGILWMNMPAYPGPLSAVDRIINQTSALLTQGKFITIFGFLFGISFSLQWMRTENQGRKPAVHCLRRLFVLFLIGVLHMVFVWERDILTWYALTGMYLLTVQCLHLSQKTILILALCIYPLIIVGGEVTLTRRIMRETGVTTIWDISPTRLRERRQGTVNEEIGQYTTASYARRIHDRWDRLRKELGSPSSLLPESFFVYFLLGLWAARSGILRDSRPHERLLRWIFWGGLPLGLTLFFVKRIGGGLFRAGQITWLGNSIFDAAWMVGQPILGFTYVSAILLIIRNDRWLRRFAPLRYAGRMALTNYLMQSLIFTLVSYSYGLGSYSSLTGAAVLLYSLVFFTAQVYLSRWWLSRFHFGPAEWVWRSLTYGSLMPWRPSSSTAVFQGLDSH